MGYETEAWRAPTPKDDEDVIFSEHGRIINNVCHRSFWFMLVKGKYHVALLVKHGGGQERIDLHHYHDENLRALSVLSSDDRFMVFSTMLAIKHDAEREAEDSTSARYRQAFAENRLHKRKNRGSNTVKIWIEPKGVPCSTA